MAVQFTREKKVPRGAYDGAQYAEVRLVDGANQGVKVQASAEATSNPWQDPYAQPTTDAEIVPAAPDADDIAQAYQVVQGDVAQMPKVVVWAQGLLFAYCVFSPKLPPLVRLLAGGLGVSLVLKNFNVVARQDQP